MTMSTREVIAELIEESSWTVRATSLETLATRFAEGSLDDEERNAVTEAFRFTLYDAEPMVRRVLAESLKSATGLPRDVLLALARDTAAVAIPILEHSRQLREDELLPIVQRGSTAHRFAIAGRRLISGPVAEALCRPGERTVLKRLVANEGAAIPEATLHWLLDHFPELPEIAEAIGRRRLLPVSVVGRLFDAIPARRVSERAALA